MPRSASGDDAGRLAVDAAGHLAELPVEEDPVVELAAPAMEVGRRRPARRTCGNAALKVRAVDRDAAAARPGALDDLDAAVLGRRPVAGRQGDRRAPGGPRCRPRPSTARPTASPPPGAVVQARVGRPAPTRTGRAGGSVADVGHPAEVVADAPPRRDRPSRADEDRRSPSGAWSRRAVEPAARGASHSGGCAVAGRRTEA